MDSPARKTGDPVEIIDCNDRPGFDAELDTALSNALAGELPQSRNSSIAIAATNASGQVVAGLSATTSYDWIHVTRLWVDDDYRR